MSLKPPGEFFNNSKKNSEKSVENFSATNLEESDISKSIDNLNQNVEEINDLSKTVSGLQSDIESLIKTTVKEDIDGVLSDYLKSVEKSIEDVQNKVRLYNSKTLVEIKEEFSDLSNIVENFVEVETPAYKNSIKESEQRIDSRFSNYKTSINEEILAIDAQISKKIESIVETVRSINEQELSSVEDKIGVVDIKVDTILEKEIPKYKKFFADTELKVEKSISSGKSFVEQKSKDIEEKYENKIKEVTKGFDRLVNSELPTYRNLLAQSKLQTESEVKELDKKILLISQNITNIQEKVSNKEIEIDDILLEKTLKIENLIDDSKKLSKIHESLYENLYKDFKKREVSENRKLESYEKTLTGFSEKLNTLENTITDDVCNLQNNLDTSTSKYYEKLTDKVEIFEKNFSDKLKDLSINFVKNETHVGNLKEEFKDIVDKLKIDFIEEKSNKLTKKVTYLENLLEKFSEKQLLTEVSGPNDPGTLTQGGPPDTKSSDPLTPLNKEFVTLDQLQQHYRLFINRVQQQVASIGGGGAGFIKDLDDVTFDQTAGTNKLLIYDGSKWVGIASTAIQGSVGAAGTWAVTSAGIHTTKNVGIATTARSGYALYVGGDQFVDGNITIGGTITYEDVKNVDSIGIITARTGIDVLAGGINAVGVSTIVTGVGTVHIGVGNTTLLVQGDARVTGILTIGQGSITLDPINKEITGIDEIVVGSGASLSLAPLFTSAGKFVVDYTKLTLKGYSTNLEGTYERQSSSFVLGTAPTSSGSARFQSYSGFYYFLHESDNSKIIIFNIVTGTWDVVHSSGSNFSSPSSGQLVNPISNYALVTPVRAFFDDTGRAYPGSGRGIEYSTRITDHTSSLGISTASSIDVSGIVTATKMHVGVDTGFHNEELVVTGDARITGILTIGTGSITLDPNERKISGIDEIIIGTATTVRIHQGTTGEVVFSDRDGKQASVGIGTTVSINTTGIVTAASFRGDGSQLTNIISGVGIQSTSTRIGTGYTDINFTGVGVTVVGSGTTITIDVPAATITRQVETSSGVTTNFTITGGYTVGLIDVFLNGTKQVGGVDFTATNGSVVTMTPFINDGDVVEFQKIDQLRIAGIVSVTNATNAFTLNSQAASYYLDYDNFTNTPTVPTNNNQLTNGAGFITTSFTNTNQLTNGAGFITTSFTNTNQLTNGAGFITGSSSGVELTGIVTSIVAGDNISISGSTGIVTITSTASGGISSVGIQSGGVLVGTAQTINFGSGVTITNDVATVSVGSTLRFFGARMYHDDYSVTTSNSWTAVTNFDGTSIDTNSFANTTNGRFTIPAGVSKVRISTNVRAVAYGNTYNQWATYKNGSSLGVINGGFNIDIDGSSGYNNPGAFGQTAIISVVEGDYFNLRYFVAGTNLDVDLWYQIEVVEGDILGTYFSATNIVDDTSPQLGGNLDVNGKSITGTGNVNLTGIVTATTFYGDGSNLTNAGASAAKSAAIASFLGR